MSKKPLLFLIAMPWLWLTLGSGDAAAQSPRQVLDWGKCDLRVAQIEFTDKLVAGSQTLTAGRRDAVLALIKVEGTAPQDGELSVAPGSFGAQFVYRGVNRIELSKAWGIRGENPDTDESIEKWTANPDERANVGATAGESVSMWFAVVLPKEVQRFHVIVPSLIEAQVPGGQSPAGSAQGRRRYEIAGFAFWFGLPAGRGRRSHSRVDARAWNARSPGSDGHRWKRRAGPARQDAGAGERLDRRHLRRRREACA